MIVGDTIWLKYGSFDLRTGEPAGFRFVTHKCADCTACATHLFARNGGCPSIYSLQGGGSSSKLSSVMRPGCYLSIIPAGGVILLPPLSSGCTCAYSLETTIAWLPTKSRR